MKLFLALACAALSSLRLAAETALPEITKPPILEACPNSQGVLSHWLAAPAVKTDCAVLTEAPRGAREGQPAPSGGVWELLSSETVFVDLRHAQNSLRSGTVWCSVRVKSLAGGKRILTGYSYGPLKAFLAGRQVFHKLAATGERPDLSRSEVELPKGESEIAVAVGMRWGCSFALTLTAANGVKPAAGDTLILPLAPERVPDPGAVLVQSMSLLAQNQSLFVSEGSPVQLELALRGGWPAGVGAVTPRFLGPDGEELAGAFPAQAPDEVHAKPWRAVFQAPKEPRACLDLKCELRAADTKRVLGAKSLRLYSIRGLREASKRLEEEYRKARAQARLPLPNTALALDKLNLWFEKTDAGLETFTEEVGRTLAGLLESARTSLAEESNGRDPFLGRLGYLERAYFSPIDQSAQPYFVQVPSAAKEFLTPAPGLAAKKFPLVIFLHGYVPDYDRHRWWDPLPEFNAHFERQGAFLAIPFGRSNADFLGPGEVDVLDVLNEIKRLYPIDEDRIYLYGYSMGGMAVYSLGGHYPGLWAAGIVIAGRADSPLLMRTGGLATLAPFKQFLIRTDQPIDLCENFVNIPLRIYHGNEDQFISPKEAQQMEARLQEIGCDAKLSILPGNHWFGFDLMCDEELVKWLLGQKRDPHPKLRKLKNYSLRFGQHQGLRVEQITGVLTPFTLEWSLTQEAVAFKRLEGSLGALCMQNLPKRTKVQLPEGETPFALHAGIFMANLTCNRTLSRTGWGPENLQKNSWKSAARCGPVKEATYGPFLLVYGTSGGEEATKRLKAQAEQFEKEWYEFAKGHVKVKADAEITDEEKKTKNLFLFGEEQENSLHAAAAATGKLPFTVKDGKVALDGKWVDLKNRGFLYLYPSPFEGAGEDRSLVLAAGFPYGHVSKKMAGRDEPVLNLPINHLLDLVPDFLLYGDQEDSDGTGTNRPIVAGFFDGKWKLNAETTGWFVDQATFPPAPKPAVEKPPEAPAPPRPVEHQSLPASDLRDPKPPWIWIALGAAVLALLLARVLAGRKRKEAAARNAQKILAPKSVP